MLRDEADARKADLRGRAYRLRRYTVLKREINDA
jgi:hypothetical protein